jgi:hypothetical protein
MQPQGFAKQSVKSIIQIGMTLIVFQPVSTGFARLDRGFQPRAGRRKQRRFVSQSGA